MAHLTSVHVPFDTRIFHKECASLRDAGYQVVLIAAQGADTVVDGIRVRAVRPPAHRGARLTRTQQLVYRAAVAEDAALYHFHDAELIPVGLLLKRRGRKVVYDVHEHYAQTIRARAWLPKLARTPAALAFHLLEQTAARRFDGIVCCTEHIAGLFPLPATIVVRNYPLVDLARLEVDEVSYAAANRTLIYTGGWTAHRGMLQIVAALGQVAGPTVRLTLVGQCQAEVERAARRLPGYGRVDYRGVVPYADNVALMRRAALGLVCNQPTHDFDRAEPNKLFEYMALGLPVIASHFPLWREIVEGHRCGVTVDPTDPAAIARAIEFLLARPELRRAMGQNGRQAIRTRFNWDHEKTGLLQLYADLLGS